jgi:curved DNA-binding protein CbpA
MKESRQKSSNGIGQAAITREAVKDAIRETYRDLAKRYHPDHGGSNEAMAAITHMKETLERRFSSERQASFDERVDFEDDYDDLPF